MKMSPPKLPCNCGGPGGDIIKVNYDLDSYLYCEKCHRRVKIRNPEINEPSFLYTVMKEAAAKWRSLVVFKV